MFIISVFKAWAQNKSKKQDKPHFLDKYEIYPYSALSWILGYPVDVCMQ